MKYLCKKCNKVCTGDVSKGYVASCTSCDEDFCSIELTQPTLTKNYKNLGTLQYKEVDRNTAKDMIVNNHYSKKWNTSFGTINIGVFKEDVLLGVAVFGNLMNPASFKSIHPDFVKGNVIELNRLWLDDQLGHNAETAMLSQCFKYIKQFYPEIKAVQSFADGRLGCGTIYKASNFKYYGFTKTDFYRHVDTEEFLHKVNFENTKRPKALFRAWDFYNAGKLELFEVKTYRYIYWLNNKTSKGCAKKELPFPAYDIGMDAKEISFSLPLMVRVHLMYRIVAEDTFNEEAVFSLIKKSMSRAEYTELLEVQRNNASISWLADKHNVSLNNL